MREISNVKDAGSLQFVNRRFAEMKFFACSLSMAGSQARSRFEQCEFEGIHADACTLGHPIFQSCQFKNIEASDTVALYSSLFVECRFSGVIKYLNFGHIRQKSPFFSEARFSQDLAAVQAAKFFHRHHGS